MRLAAPQDAGARIYAAEVDLMAQYDHAAARGDSISRPVSRCGYHFINACSSSAI
jgi:hypothetical protein